jgi:D-alanine-D-alanine ligase
VESAALDLAPPGEGPRFVRWKRRIGPLSLTLLALAACLPLVLVLCRTLALPGGESLPLGPFRELGKLLDQWLTLDWIPPHDRPSILYLILLPTGVLLVTIARMTLGVRVLGFRAILIAFGFKASGFLPSLALMAVVVGTVVLIRPWFRRIGLPMYGRLGVILCLSSSTMVAAVLVAPWFRSEMIWNVAFFPVIIMAMMAEGIAKTLEEDNAVTAAWRAGTTILLALVIRLVDWTITPLVYRFPELIFTEVISIVFVAEFFDLRLLEEWPARLSRLVDGARPWYTAKPRIAVVRSDENDAVIGGLGAKAPAKYRRLSVQRPVDALREQGFQVKVLDGDVTLLRELQRYLPPDPARGTPGGIVLNLATGVQGEGRFGHVPAMLELAGIPYTGPGPGGHAQLADRFVLLTLLEQADVAVPRCRLVSDPSMSLDLDLPLSVRPRLEPDAGRTIARDRRRLQAAVRRVRRAYGQACVVEEVVHGRRILVSVLGNETLECLPLVEDAADGTRICPAHLDDATAERVRTCARKSFAATGCRDYARIEVRVSPFGEPIVVDVRWVDLFERRGAFVTAATEAGYTFPALMRRIVDEAAQRYLALAAAHRPAIAGSDRTSEITSPATRRAAAD